jgi:glycosyltransferase involved in cell wall biosynthesis
MNVSFVLPSLSRQGGGLFDIGRRLAQELHGLPETRVSVVGVRDGFTDADASQWTPLTVAACEKRGPRILGWAPGYSEALTKQHPEVVHQHGVWTLGSLETTRFCRSARVPLVVSVHGMIEPWALEHSKWKKRAAWLGYQSANLQNAGCILVNSNTEAGYVRSCKITTPIAVIPNGVDRLVGSGEAPAWQTALGPERRVLLFLGRIHPKKGVFELVRAWAQFVNDYPDRARNWSLVVTGWDDGGHDAKLRALAQELDLRAPTFHMTGPLFGVARDAALSNADGFILPSYSEGMPMAALEALAVGMPLLLTDACNLPKVAEAGAGLRIGTTSEEICDGMLRLAALTREQHADMAQRAKELAQRIFSWPNAARDTARVYAWLLGAGARPTDLLV